MKVLMLINSFSGGGGEKVFVNLANNWFERKDTEIVYVVGCDVGPNKKNINPKINIKRMSGRLSTWAILINIYKYFIWLHKYKPQVVFSTLELSNAINVTCTKLYNIITKNNIKIVTREANTLTAMDSNNLLTQSNRGFTGKLLDKIYSYYIHNSDFIIANSNDTMKDVVSFRGVIKDKITSIPNPVLEKLVACDGISYSRVGGERVDLVSVGRLTFQKNYEFSLMLIDYMRKLGVNIHLDIYGTGELKEQIESLINSLELQHHVSLKGYSNSISQEMHRYDAFLMTSLWEGFGNVIVEALSCGLPVITSRCPGGPKDIICDERLGSVCEFDITRFSESIISQIANDSQESRIYRCKKSNDYSSIRISERYYQALGKSFNV
ncbi:glycosyltransferase [Vibrio breoganii]|uniref:glycosyltransferase n=1 Tax=Vibrio breoganii TaxID=553239 RepID=UPI000C82BC78|nr:glycosyltransferase [Vibrio breoganii]PML40665.1 hypothetical protein BCT77_00445 [Vibrio breoganii]PMO71035.1 hypothetical protein BCT02_02085 [Vibrio breoganii]PMO90477.1 hypothetical protein BCS99_04695 [Vibrio breoganii]